MNAKFINIFILSFVVCMLASCSEEDAPNAVDPDKGYELIFDVAEQSRATATTGLNFDGSQFAIYGNMRLGDHNPLVIFDKTIVTHNKGKWYYDNTQYWFPKHEHSFIAIHPVEASGLTDTNYSDSQLSFTYTVPDNYEAAKDLMIATHRRQLSAGGTSYLGSTVRLSFFHTLSRIDFKLTNNKAADFVKVTQLKLMGINRTGSYTIIPAPLSEGSEQTDDYISSWSGISNKGDLTANLNFSVPENVTSSLFPDENALFMIPQPDNNNVIMEITYEQWDDGAKFEEHTLLAATPIGGWESGKTYTYSMTVSEITKEVYLTVSVKNWQGLNNSATIPVPEY